MGYNDVRVTLPLLLKGYCFLRVSYLYEQMRLSICKKHEKLIGTENSIIFAATVNRNATVVECLFKGKPVALSNLFYFSLF